MRYLVWFSPSRRVGIQGHMHKCCMLLSLYFPVTCNPSRAVTLPQTAALREGRDPPCLRVFKTALSLSLFRSLSLFSSLSLPHVLFVSCSRFPLRSLKAVAPTWRQRLKNLQAAKTRHLFRGSFTGKSNQSDHNKYNDPSAYSSASLIRKCTPLGSYGRPMPRVPGGS